jgi:hypothetical protein
VVGERGQFNKKSPGTKFDVDVEFAEPDSATVGFFGKRCAGLRSYFTATLIRAALSAALDVTVNPVRIVT